MKTEMKMQEQIKQVLGRKIIFIAMGLLNIVAFHYSIYRLWHFLFDSSGRLIVENKFSAYFVNLLLILFFSVPHSLLLSSTWKKKLLKYIPQGLYPSIYSLHASIGIILMDQFWVSSSTNMINFGVTGYKIISIFYLFSWIFMFWSMLATGLFRQSGIEQWWKSLNQKKIDQGLSFSGPYQFCRHPIYASFLGMIWFTPNMTSDRLFLAISWTLYIFVGASLKEKRLRRNKIYLDYAKSVPSFPFIPMKWDNYLTSIIGSK
jgi:protein-S-isoprenylcysteine O-methyltransferase Ste14